MGSCWRRCCASAGQTRTVGAIAIKLCRQRVRGPYRLPVIRYKSRTRRYKSLTQSLATTIIDNPGWCEQLLEAVLRERGADEGRAIGVIDTITEVRQ